MRYNGVVRWLGLLMLLAACGQDDNYFRDPTPNNLGKNPYDFATMKYPRDFSATVLDDLSVNLDLGGDDLGVDAAIPDLARKPDGNTTDHPDLSG